MTSLASATIVAELTPPGRAAVAVVVIAGPDATRVVGNCFVARSGRAVADIQLGQIALGRWGSTKGEELVLCRREVDQIEIHCHGGLAAVRAIIDRLVEEGCQQRTWQEWVRQSSPDRIQAQSQIALADAVSERTAGILLDQYNGALRTAVSEVIAHITASDWPAADAKITELLDRREIGLHLVKPWRAVVFGAPNVGKSSLMNALAGYERAIVSPIPGTTRDVVSIATAVDGWPLQLSDTAGFREAEDELEAAGIKLATKSLAKAELAIFVYDATSLFDDDSANASSSERPMLEPQVRVIHVVNKIDLVPLPERPQLLKRFADSRSPGSTAIAVSALHGEGIAELLAAIGGVLAPTSFPAGTAVPFTWDQVENLAAAKAAIEQRDAIAASKSLHAMLTDSH